MTKLNIDGQARLVQAEPETPLLWALRGELGVLGPKFGCGMALCGACTVLVDGVPTRACVTPMAMLEGKTVTTVQGLEGPQADAVRRAWDEVGVVQCGYCQSGQIVAASALLREVPKPTDAQIDEAMRGHLCRCGTYPRIRQAIHAAARALGAGR
jgi:isoquinoline 1-oxidoreductase alpha subunit